MITTALAALAAGSLGALEWRRIARRHPDVTMESALRHARHLVAVIPFALALLAAQIWIVTYPDVTWGAPVWVELHHAELLLGSVVACISFIFGLATYGAFATRHPQRVAAVASMGMVIGIVLAIERDFTRPIADRLHDRTRDGIVLQSSGSSCAAASAANFARQYGITRTEPEMAALLGTTRFGSSPAQVAHGLSQLGFSCRKTVLPGSDPRPLRAPAVLFFPPSAAVDVGHAVLYTGADGSYTTVLDPLIGRRLLSSAELAARWKGHAVECVATGVAIPATAVPTVIEAPTAPKAAAPAWPALCPNGRRPVAPAPCPGKTLAEALHCPGRHCREGTVWNGKACVPPCGEPDGG